MKTIVVVDTLGDGHHPIHFRSIVGTLLSLSYRVVALCPNPCKLYEEINTKSFSWGMQLSAFKIQEPEQVYFPIKRFRPTLTTILRWKSTANLIEKIKNGFEESPDLIFFPWMDNYLDGYLLPSIIDRIFPYNWSGIYHQVPHLRIKPNLSVLRYGFLDPLSVLHSPRCRNIAVMDSGIAWDLQKKIHSKAVIPFPDIVDCSPPDLNFFAVKKIKEKVNDRKIVGLLGSQSKRKGFLTLLEVAQTTQKNYFFVFAGNFAEYSFSMEELTKIRNVIGSNPENCFFCFDCIEDEHQFNALVDACDILYIAYENYPFISNILTKAAIFKKPVVAEAKFYIGETTQKFDLGVTITSGDIQECIDALYRISNFSEEDLLKHSLGCEEYQYYNSPKALENALKRVLAEVT